LDGEWIPRQRYRRRECQTGGMAPTLNFWIGKTKAAMGMIAAQMLKLMGGKIYQ
jgi:hypothetical protein